MHSIDSSTILLMLRFKYYEMSGPMRHHDKPLSINLKNKQACCTILVCGQCSVVTYAYLAMCSFKLQNSVSINKLSTKHT